MGIPHDLDIKQAVELRDSIMRLCNEADTREIAINGLLNAFVDLGIEGGLSPTQLCKVMIEGICLCTKHVTPRDLLFAMRNNYGT